MENYAFISYSHADLKAVRRLHKRIENFKLPRFVRRLSEDCPKRLYPIFRDETDLSGHGLTPTIRKALADSRYLIVVCTEASAASEWVALEIDTFLETHSPDAMIPVFLDAKTKTAFGGSFPGSLRDLALTPNDPLLYTFPRRKRCLFEITTHLLGQYSPWLTHRYMDKRDIPWLIKAMAVSILCLIVYTDLRWLYDDHNDTVRYYRDVSFWCGWPEGVEELSPLTLSQETDYYICTFRSHRIVALEHIYPESCAPTFPGHYLLEADRMEFAYNNNWGPDGYATARISKIIYKDRDGNTLFVKNPSLTLDVVDLTVSAGSCEPYYLPEDMTCTSLPERPYADTPQTAGYCRIGQNYDEAGRICRIWLLSDTFSYMIPDQNGYYGIEFGYDDTGNVGSVRYLDIDGTVLAEYIP